MMKYKSRALPSTRTIRLEMFSFYSRKYGPCKSIGTIFPIVAPVTRKEISTIEIPKESYAHSWNQTR